MSPPPAVLGIDLGTTKSAAVVLDGRTGRPLAVESGANRGALAAPPGRSEWDADALVAGALEVAARAVRAAGVSAVEAIGVTGQMHGMVLVDRARRPLTPFVGWQDRRCLEPAASTTAGPPAMDEIEGRLAGLPPRRTGCRLAPGYMAATLYWLKREGAIPRGARATFAPDLLAASLSGRREAQPVTDPTNAGSAGVLDVVQRVWDVDAIRALGLPVAIFPEVVPSGAVVGRLAADVAAALGLAGGTPVVNAIGDNQASVLGSLSDPAHEVLVNVGTGAQLSAVVADPAAALHHDSLEVRCFPGESALLVGARGSGGNGYAALAAFVEGIGRQVFGRGAGPASQTGAVAAGVDIASGAAGADLNESLYETLNALAGAIPAGAGGLRCDPSFFGDRHDPGRRGAYTQITADTFTIGHVARATLEGTAASLAELYAAMRVAGMGGRSRVVGAGNAIRRNRLFAEILATHLGVPLTAPPYAEEAARGAALLAAGAAGAPGDRSDGSDDG